MKINNISFKNIKNFTYMAATSGRTLFIRSAACFCGYFLNVLYHSVIVTVKALWLIHLVSHSPFTLAQTTILKVPGLGYLGEV